MFPVVVTMARYQNGKETVLEGYGGGINLSPILNLIPYKLVSHQYKPAMVTV
jgi:hypothetical protein